MKRWRSSRNSVLLWELVAFVALLIALGTLTLPLLDALLMKNEPREILVRIQIQEAGAFEPDEITVKVGETVRLKFIALDVPHSFVSHKLGIKSALIVPGKDPLVIEFTPKEVGVIAFQCGTVCSPQHLFLKGRLIVVEG